MHPTDSPSHDDSHAHDSRADGSRADDVIDARTEGRRPEGSVEQSTQGVGPWPGGPDAWPEGDHYDRELLERGDSRNVIDRYRYWRMDAIVADLDQHRHPFHVAIENWQHDMNIGSIVRSANAFAADTVHIVGRKRWNKRGAMVTDRYQHVLHHPDIAALVAWAGEAGLPIIAVDNVPGAVLLETYSFPRECLLLFGQEGPGLSPEAIAAAETVVEISQFGSTRSINASAAAAVTMHAWVREHHDFGAGPGVVGDTRPGAGQAPRAGGTPSA